MQTYERQVGRPSAISRSHAYCSRAGPPQYRVSRGVGDTKSQNNLMHSSRRRRGRSGKGELAPNAPWQEFELNI